MVYSSRHQQLPDRSSLILEYDIQFQACELQEMLNNCKNSNNTCSIINKSSAAITIKKLNTSSDSFLADNGKNLNLITINDLFNPNNDEVEDGSEDNGNLSDKPECYLLCRVITPLIQICVQDKKTNPKKFNYLTILEEPSCNSCSSALKLNILTSVVEEDDVDVNVKLPMKLLNEVLPLGTVILIKDPIKYFTPELFALEFESSSNDILILNSGSNILNNVPWKNSIPKKYLKFVQDLDYKGAPAEATVKPKIQTKNLEQTVALLWNSKKYKEAIELLESKGITAESTAATTDMAHHLLAKSQQYYNQTTFGENYPIHSWLSQLEKDKNSLQELDCAEYEGPVKITQIEGKGRGLIATEFIPAGKLVLAKNAFVISFIENEILELVENLESNSNSIDFKEAFDNWTNILNSNKIARRLVKYPEDSVELYKLFAGPDFKLEQVEKNNNFTVDLDRIIEIVKYNGFINRPNLDTGKKSSSSDSSRFASQMASGLWLLVSYINHSCSDTNVFWKIYGNFMFIRAFKDIQPGEEILMSYRGGLYNLPYNERKQQLFKPMGFFNNDASASGGIFPVVVVYGCGCNLCKIESNLSRRINTDLCELIQEVQMFSCNIELLLISTMAMAASPENGKNNNTGKIEFYKLQIVDIIKEIKSISNIASTKSKALDLYLYQPLKLLAMIFIIEKNYKQAFNTLEECYNIIVNSNGESGGCDLEKSIGCGFDIICTLLKIDDNISSKELLIQKWFEIVKKNIGIIYGDDCKGNVLEIFLNIYKLNESVIIKGT